MISFYLWNGICTFILKLNFMKLNIGIDKKSLTALGQLLNGLLADELLLLAKTKKFHWNVTGPHFRSVHLHLDEIYAVVDTAIDEVAERLGYAEQTSFGRAFKRWTGQTPRQFRQG